MSDIDSMNLGPRWYVAHTYSGYENKVKTNLEKIVENRGLSHLIFDIRIPTETVVENDGEAEKTTESKLFPSYVLVKMVMSDESWHVVRNIRGVTGFVGPGSKPVPLTDEEVAALLTDEVVTADADEFKIGDSVDIAEGIFAGYSGKLSEIAPDGSEVTVVVSTVGRDMPIKLDIKHIRRSKPE